MIAFLMPSMQSIISLKLHSNNQKLHSQGLKDQDSLTLWKKLHEHHRKH